MDRHPKETWSQPTTPSRKEATTPRPRPNFSGEYSLDRYASKLEGGAASARGAVLRIDHHEPMIRIDARFEFFDQTYAWSLQRICDGREIVDQSDTRTKSSLRWDDSALLFTHRTDAPTEVTMTWRYELADSGDLTAVEEIRGGGRDQDNVWVFNRR